MEMLPYPVPAAPAVIAHPDLERKLEILADAAKYDASCASSGTTARRNGARTGNVARSGICHSWSSDGRCISLLKVLFSNACVYDCAFCVNRCSNPRPRATFTVEELVQVTLNFYRRNYIEGLFLSSAVCGTPDRTMEALVRVAETLRRTHGFGGYIHLKAIPGASADLVERAGQVADRLSVNIELPSEQSLRALAPQKRRAEILQPMEQIGAAVEVSRAERRRSRRAPVFAPAGQSTQLIVGASPESDFHILRLADSLYGRFHLKRVYYSAYVPVNEDNRLPVLHRPPLLREHRLYQADWLMRLYGFRLGELFDRAGPQLDEALDPKADWALRHPELFPVEVNRADYEMLLRVPGLGRESARRICQARRFASLHEADLRKMGVVLKRARHFLTAGGRHLGDSRLPPSRLRMLMMSADDAGRAAMAGRQLGLF